jgi:predicted O-methyltransferase YrrM
MAALPRDGEFRDMSRSLLPEAVDTYLHHTAHAETPLARRLREETAKLPMGMMQIGVDQGAFLALLVRLVGARRCLEIGTFTGYSALAVARALPADGRLVCCDISDEWTRIGRRYWDEAGVAGRIDLRLAPAADTLRDLLRDPGAGSFDFAFIDADKTGYDGYYEACLTLLRSGGLMAFDNTLWSGKVADPAQTDADTTALRALNLKVRDDPRVTSCLVSMGDGVLLALKH